MNNVYKLFLLIPIIVFGCKSKDIENKITGQRINSLNMNILSNEGKKLIKIESPYSTYNNNLNTFNLKETTIHLFNNNETEYIIKADKSQLSNNKLLLLNGNVLVKSVIQ